MKGFTSSRAALVLATALAAAAAQAAEPRPASPRPAAAQGIAPRLEAAVPGPLPLLPPTNWWNVDVSAAPVDAGSDGFLGYIDAQGVRPLHPDFGGTLPDGMSIYGFPYIVVGAGQTKRTVEFVEPSESDGVDHSTETSFPFYPIPDEAITQPHWVEGGAPGNVDLTGDEDRHVLIVDRDARVLYELYNVFYDGSTWHAYSGAAFDLASNDRRPDGWTSADAAGLAILPGLVRYDEAYGDDEIRHAFRMTVRHTNGYVYPASHKAGLQDPPALPMGARLRLKSGVQVSSADPGVQRIVRALKTYGMIVADNGTDMYVSGTWDERWDNDILNPALGQLTASDFEVVQLGWEPALSPALAVDERPGGTSNTNGVFEPGESVIVEPSWENADGASASLAGAASSFTGPAGATYTIADAAAAYGSPASGAPASCWDATGNCYRLTLSNPAARPAGHWDATRHGEGQRHRREDLDPARRRQFRRRRVLERLLRADRDSLPRRRHCRLQRIELLPVVRGDARADGGFPAQGEVREGLPATAGFRHHVRRRAVRRLRGRLDRGPGRERDLGGLRGRALLSGRLRDAGADGRLPAEGGARQRLRSAAGLGSLRRRSGGQPLRAVDRAARGRGRDRRLRRRQLLPGKPQYTRPDGRFSREDLRAEALRALRRAGTYTGPTAGARRSNSCPGRRGGPRGRPIGRGSELRRYASARANSPWKWCRPFSRSTE